MAIRNSFIGAKIKNDGLSIDIGRLPAILT